MDNFNDNKLSKNIRPIVLFTMLGLLIILFILDIIKFKAYSPNTELLHILSDWGGYAIMFYFGSRGVQYVTKMYTERNNNKSSYESEMEKEKNNEL